MSFIDRLKVFTAKTRKSITAKRVGIAAGAVGVILIIIPVITYFRFANDISDRERLMNRQSTGLVVRDRNGEPLYSYGNLNAYTELNLEQISDNLEQAVLASEDQEFYNHEGYSVKGIARALYGNLLNKDPVMYGGSTITQQLVKNKLLGKSKNYFRKYQEVTMAIAVERHYSKREIMEMYLNSVYFGEGAFGVAAAADTYFGKSAADLTVEESAMLVAMLPAPSVYSPISGDDQKAKERQSWVLSRMKDTGYINAEKEEAAKKQGLKYASKPGQSYSYAQHFVMMVIEQLNKKYGEAEVARSGFDVTTSLDLNWQKAAEKSVKSKVEEIKKFNADNASLVAIDPASGEIKILVGSVDWNNKQYGRVNMAVTPRQPGSSFKPIYYAKALQDKTVTAATILEDKPTKWAEYEPQNYDFKFRGNLPLRQALAQSLNIPAVSVMEKLGVEKAVETAQELGLEEINQPDKYGLALALGTAEEDVVDMTSAYSTFANQGEQNEPILIKKIKDKYGNTVEEAQQKPKSKISPEASFLISSILSDQQARAPTFGQALNIDGKQAAVKTGTTNDSKDAWTIGYTPDLTVGVWVGNNRHEAMQGLLGSTSAGAIWKETIASFSQKQNGDAFIPTGNIIESEVCVNGSSNVNGDRRYKEFFIKGTEKNDCQRDNPNKVDAPPKKRDEKDDNSENQPQDRVKEPPKKRNDRNQENNNGTNQPDVNPTGDNPSGGGSDSPQPNNNRPQTTNDANNS